MKILTNIFNVFIGIVFATTAVFADQKCGDPEYRRNHPSQCAKIENQYSMPTTLMALVGGVALIGVGAALAANTSSGGNNGSGEITNQNTFMRSSNVSLNYTLNDKIQNNKIYTSYIGSATNGSDVPDDVLQSVKNSTIYQKNPKQFDSINLAWALGRGYTGKNVDIAVMDDFNYYHGNAVSDLTKYVAKDANIETYNLTTSAKSFVSFDAIANIMKSAPIADVYNNSWQITSTATKNAATVIYNNTETKTYKNAQQYMYDITSPNFITQVINTAIDNDSIFVWAAGNDKQTESGAMSAMPLAFPELNGHFVNVVALDTRTNKLAWYSNQCGITQNYCITAPGSTLKTDAKASSSGTSFAAPIVSGAIAVIKEAFPYMNANQITQLLFTTAKDLGEEGVDAVYGWGLLNMEAATKPVGTPKIVVSNENIQPLSGSSVSGIAASAIKNAGIEIAFIDDFGRAFTTKLSDNLNVVPYGRGFEKLQEQENDSVSLFKNLEFGFKKLNIFKSNGFMASKSDNLTDFIGYKNEFNFGGFSIYQNTRFGISNPKAENDSIISGFSYVYTTSMKTGIKYNDFSLEFAIPDTIIHGNMYLDVPIDRANNGNIVYKNTNIDLKTKPSTEYTLKYKNVSATYVNNNDYQDEIIVMAKTKLVF